MSIRDFAAEVDHLFASWQRPGAPGGAIAVVDRGEVVLRRSYGLASLEHGVPNTTGTAFHIASITKTFVAAACVLLAAERKLDLDAPMKALVPEMRSGDGVTIRQLLTMTSGLRDSWEMLRLAGMPTSHPRTRDDLMWLATRQSAMNFPVASRFSYTNVNFVLLSLIIERATGRTVDQVFEDRLFRPLGMAHTALRSGADIVVPNLASGYWPVAGDDGIEHHRVGLHGVDISGAGQGVSTVEDLVHWLMAWRSGRIGDVAVFDEMAEPGVLADGSPMNYGLGTFISGHRGLVITGHGGSLPGYKAHLGFARERDFGVVILSNREDTVALDRVKDIVDIFLDQRLDMPKPAVAAERVVAASSEIADAIEHMTGRWFDAESGEMMTVTAKGAELEVDKLGLDIVLQPTGPETPDQFANPTGFMPYRLARDGDDLVLTAGGRVQRFRKLDPFWAETDEFPFYVGRYYCEALDAWHEVSADEDRLTISFGQKPHGRMTFLLEPVASDVFRIDVIEPNLRAQYAIRFERGAEEHATGFRISSDRLKDTVFVRT